MPHTHLPAQNAFTKGQARARRRSGKRNSSASVTLHDASTVAAVIVEPVAGSTGVLIPPKGYLKKLREICTKHGILLIFDEGHHRLWPPRLGPPPPPPPPLWAAQHYDVMPDMITSAKGLTNGVIPMGAVFVTSEIHDTFMTGPGASDRILPRLHLFGQKPDRLGRRSRHARHLQGKRGLLTRAAEACALLGRAVCIR